MQSRTRSAFTLFQLIVILAIGLILLGLLLPAIAKVRAAAGRSRSQNNMKQIALGLHNYHDQNGRLAPGVDANHFSTATYILPYIEQDNLYKQVDFKKPMDDKANAAARQANIMTFISPLDPLFKVANDLGSTNYLYCAGAKPGLKDNDGLLFQESKIRFADVTDGLSNTIMTGETLKGDGAAEAKDVRRQHVLLDKDALKSVDDEAGVKEWKDNKKIAGNRCASWMDGRFLQGTFTGNRVPNDERPDVSCAGEGGLSALRGLQPVFNVGMGDGSVRAITKNIKLETWKALCTRNGGEVVNPDF